MRILLTNDDGYDAPGLVALYEAAKAFGHVTVAAPSRERSACSHMITMHEPIQVRPVTHALYESLFIVEGTPADCVRVALTRLLEEPVDLVLSGINRGANAGVDLYYSGTVAGAREGAILGYRSISISHAVKGGQPVDWAAASRAAAYLVQKLWQRHLPEPGFWSVNLPTGFDSSSAMAIERGIRYVSASFQPMPMEFDETIHADGELREYRYGAYYWDREVGENEDFAALRQGFIAVSAIALNSSMRGMGL